MAGEMAEMDSLFEGMDFVMPLDDESKVAAVDAAADGGVVEDVQIERQGSHLEGLKRGTPEQKPAPPSNAMIADSIPPSTEVDHVVPSATVPSSVQTPRSMYESLTPSAQANLQRNTSGPLDESLFSGLIMASADDGITSDLNVEEAEKQANAAAPSASKTTVGLGQHENSRSFDDLAGEDRTGNGEKEGSRRADSLVTATAAAYRDASPQLTSFKHTSSGSPSISKSDSNSSLSSSTNPPSTNQSVKPSIRRKKRSVKIGYGREEEENEESASRKAGIREAIGAALFGKDALSASSTSTPRYGLSRESSQGRNHVDDSAAASDIYKDMTYVNGVELAKVTSDSRYNSSEYSTLEVHGIERIASRELHPDDVAGHHSNHEKPDIVSVQSRALEIGEKDTSNQIQIQSESEINNLSIEEAATLDGEVRMITVELPLTCMDDVGEAEPAGEDVERERVSDAAEGREEDLDLDSLVQPREGTIEEKLQRVQELVDQKSNVLHQKVTAVSALRKAAVQKRRQAAEKVAAASLTYKELEAELEAACEREDFEKADSLSGSILDAEISKAQAVEAFDVAEAERDSAASKLQEVLDLQVDVEEKGALLFALLKEEAEDAARMVLGEAQETASRETERLVEEEKTAELKAQQLDREVKDLGEAKAELDNTIKDLTQAESGEKESLVEKRSELSLELQKLMEMVRAKEWEIADYDDRIAAVEGKVSVVAATFEKQKSELHAELEKRTLSALQLEKECNIISEGKQEIRQLLADAEEERLILETLASRACDAAKAMQDVVGIKKAGAVAIRQSREKRAELLEKEKACQADAHQLRENAASLRISLQDITLVKAKLSQDLSSVKERINFVEKRGPELDTEKKLAAAARNFKVAGRLAAEAKVLAAEKEEASTDMAKIMEELEKVEEAAEVKVRALAGLDALVSTKEKEEAVAHCQRLRLVAAAARDERDVAIEMNDSEEAESLDSEAKAADAEAEALQRLHRLEGKEFEIYGDAAVSTSNADSSDRDTAIIECKRLRSVAAEAKDGRDAASKIDNFEEAEALHSVAEAADAEADRLQSLHQLEGKQFESRADSKEDGGETADVQDEAAASADCERLRLAAVAARDERDKAVERDDFEAAENLDNEAEAADAEADRLQKLFLLEGSQYERRTTDERRE